MEYCNLGNIQEIIFDIDNNERFIWTFIMKISRALAYIHSKNIIHSDIKPDAILCHNDDRKGLNVKLADFGSAWDGNLTKKVEYESELYRGNFLTVPPEVLRNEAFGKPADIWAFGATIAFVCNRRYLFVASASNIEEVKQNILSWSGRATPLAGGIHKYSLDLNILVMSMLNPDPKHRPTAKKIWSIASMKLRRLI